MVYEILTLPSSNTDLNFPMDPSFVLNLLEKWYLGGLCTSIDAHPLENSCCLTDSVEQHTRPRVCIFCQDHQKSKTRKISKPDEKTEPLNQALFFTRSIGAITSSYALM